MRLAIFGLTVSSSWGNGHATLWRGLWRALARRGHHLTFFERDVPYYADNRDLRELPGGDLVFYADWQANLARARRALRDADAAIVSSYCPDGVAATRLLLDTPTRAVKVFYVDVGTVHGYREALNLLGSRGRKEEAAGPRLTQICSNEGTPMGVDPASAAPASSPWSPGPGDAGDAAQRPARARPVPGGASERRSFTRGEIEAGVHGRGNWFQNLDLFGVRTAPAHFLGDFPMNKWKRFSHVLPEDLAGRSVLDIGCNAGFYSFEMKRRGAGRVVAIDFDDYYLDQARFAAQVLGHDDIEFRRMSVYDVGALQERFDLVLFMGLVYHLRHPLLALDLVHAHVAKDLVVYQSLQRGSPSVEPLQDDYDFWETEVFERPGYPRLHFVEKKYSHDETNWWIPNAACSAAMLRSSGFRILAHPEEEVFLCKRVELPAGPDGPRAVYPAKAAP